MKKSGLLFTGLITALALTFGYLWFAPKQVSPSVAASINRTGASGLNDSSGTPTPPVSISDMGSDELAPPDLMAGADAIDVLPTAVPGETQVYFVPTDNDATATVLYLYNTDNIAHVVALRGFSYNGVLVYSLNVNVGATSFLRLASDSIAAAPPPSWATPAPIISNFTDFTYFASLSLPKGVKAEGYVLFNPGTGVVDPRKDQGAIPLRFSTDPASLFMPAIQR